MPEKIKGSVKWFNNRKGFGFITPTSDNSPTDEDIFCHVSDIVIAETTKYRTLKDGFETEFEVVTEESGKLRAISITSADGSPCPGPEPKQRRKPRSNRSGEIDEAKTNENSDEDEGEDANANASGKRTSSRKKRNNNAKNNGDDDGDISRPPSWETGLEESVQVAMKLKDIKVDAGRAFLSIGDARVKLGTDGYSALAHAEALLAEGTWTVEPNGVVTTTWDRVLKLGDNNEWILSTVVDEKELLLTEINLSDALVLPTGGTETTNSLWGENKEDPKDALDTNGFQMRRMVLHVSQSGRRRGKGRQRRYANKNNGNQTAE